MTPLSPLQAIVLGLVQGLTEYIPVSSTAHLRIVPSLLGWGDPGAPFTAVLQLGTLVAVLGYFWRDIARFTVGAVGSLFSAEARRGPDARMAWAIAAGNVPIVVLGLAFRHAIETELRSLYVIGAMLIVIALALAWAERRGEGSGRFEALGLWGVIAIGAWQALALIPGSSRSGSTILGGLLLGLRREDAARFSFLLGIPAILGAALLELPKVLGAVRAGDLSLSALALGLLAALVVGYASIAFLLRYLQRHSTALFIVYRLALAALVLGLAASGTIR
jgi:undecaprenyl-diphosphatase